MAKNLFQQPVNNSLSEIEYTDNIVTVNK